MDFPCFYSFSWLFWDFVDVHDFLRFCSFLWLSLFFIHFMTFWDIVHIMTFPVSLILFVHDFLRFSFPVFIHFHDFLRFCSFSWLWDFVHVHDFWDFVHFHDFFEILFIFIGFPFFFTFFVTFWDFVHVHEILFMFTPLYKMTGKCEPKSCSVVHPKKIKIQFFHSCSFNLCCVKRCGTEGENLKERDFFKCFFLMTLPI